MAENLDPDSIQRANQQLENLSTNTELVNEGFGKTKNVSDELTKSLSEITKNFTDLVKISKSQLIQNFNELSDTIEDVDATAEKSRKAQERREQQYAESLGFIKTASGEYVEKLKQQSEERKKVEDEINKQIGSEAILRVKQQELLNQQLQSLGVARDENGKWRSTTIDLNEAQKEQLKQAREFVEKGKAEKNAGKNILGMSRAAGTFEGVVDTASGKIMEMADKAELSKTAYIGLGIGIQAVSISLTGMKKVLDASIDAQANYVRSLLAGQRGAALEARRNEEIGKAVNGVIKQLGELATSAGVAGVALSLMIPGGILIKAFTAALGIGTAAVGVYTQYTAKAADKVLEFQTQLAELKDKVFEGFNTLGEASLSSAQGMTGLRELMKSLRMSSADVGIFTNIVKGATKDLAMLGQGTLDGLNKFTKTASDLINSTLGTQLRYMGITNEKQAEHVLKFMVQQTRLGFSQEHINKNLAQTAGKYVKELDSLAVLTGATRQEQEQARAAALAHEELRARLLTAKDDKEKERIQKQIDFIATLEAQGQKDLAEGAKRYYAAGGRIVDESSQKFALSMRETSKRVLKGEGTLAENIMKGTTEAFNSVKRLAGITAIDRESTKELIGSTVQAADAMLRIENIRKKALQEGKDPEKEIAKYIEDLAKKRETTDKNTREQAEKIENQRKEAIKREETVLKDFGTAVNLFREGVDAFKKYATQLSGPEIIPGPVPSVEEATTGREEAEKKVAIAKEIREKASDQLEEANLKNKELKKQLAKAEQDRNEVERQRLLAEIKKSQEEIERLSGERQRARVEEFRRRQEAEIAKAKEQSARIIEGKEQAWRPKPATLPEVTPKVPGKTSPESKPSSPSKTGPGSKTSQTSPGVGPHALTTENITTKLATVQSKTGKTASVNQNFAPAFQGLIDHLDAVGYDIRVMGGYNNREIPGYPGLKSIHAHGAALDINPGTNPMGSKLVTDMPSDISSVAAQYGLGWGGDWRTKKDAMHFSAATSEGGSLLQARYGGMFSGPDSGYPVLLHGKETVIPTPNLGDFTKTVMSATKQELPATPINSVSSGESNLDKFVGIQSELMSMISNKLDALDSKLARSNDIQENILTYSLA